MRRNRGGPQRDDSDRDAALGGRSGPITKPRRNLLMRFRLGTALIVFQLCSAPLARFRGDQQKKLRQSRSWNQWVKLYILCVCRPRNRSGSEKPHSAKYLSFVVIKIKYRQKLLAGWRRSAAVGDDPRRNRCRRRPGAHIT